MFGVAFSKPKEKEEKDKDKDHDKAGKSSEAISNPFYFRIL